MLITQEQRHQADMSEGYILMFNLVAILAGTTIIIILIILIIRENAKKTKSRTKQMPILKLLEKWSSNVKY